MSSERKITELPDLVAALPPEERSLVERLFEIEAVTGHLAVPDEMRGWVERSFGSVEAVEEQQIVRVTNRITLEGTLFNGLRNIRPLDTRVNTYLDREIEETEGDPFCNPQTETPADTFGRLRGEYAVTASNVAKYDALHGLVVFDDHNPLEPTPEKVSDYIGLGLLWLERAREEDSEAVYPFLMWNCLWRAGGSIIHGHAQMTATRRFHNPKVERLRRDALSYRAQQGSGYFEDLYRAHRALGLEIPAPEGVCAFASLTPVKDKELVLLGDSAEDEAFQRAVGDALQKYVRELGVTSFNVAFYMPPSVQTEEEWSGFPVQAYVVDRGNPANRTSDMGAMELYAASVVASDPFAVAAAVREA
jgi:hypothetical protein